MKSVNSELRALHLNLGREARKMWSKNENLQKVLHDAAKANRIKLEEKVHMIQIRRSIRVGAWPLLFKLSSIVLHKTCKRLLFKICLLIFFKFSSIIVLLKIQNSPNLSADTLRIWSSRTPTTIFGTKESYNPGLLPSSGVRLAETRWCLNMKLSHNFLYDHCDSRTQKNLTVSRQ